MPESWDAGEYRNRATAWLQKAESLPEGHEREACFALAEGYVRLAEFIEAPQGTAVVSGSACHATLLFWEGRGRRRIYSLAQQVSANLTSLLSSARVNRPGQPGEAAYSR